ncbi:MAG: hypothetical protein JSR34_10420 [Proteobacteria bacterium]|nr:hypothetical protein [Pseudomonadota bacterium]
MNTHRILCALVVGVAMATATPAVLAHDTAHAAHASSAAATAPQLHAALRGLWHGHLVATHDYALAVHAGNKAAQAKTADAVVANAKQIADAVAGFYGKPAGDGLLKLLAGHWQGVKDLTDAAHAGDKAGENKAMQALAANAGEIAKFLAGANPNWTEASLQGALMMHTADHQAQVDLLMAGAPQAQQDAGWTKMQEHMNMIADVLADGIAKQFPDKAK